MKEHIKQYKQSKLGVTRNESSLSYRRLWLNITQGNGGGDPLNQTDFTPEVQYFTDRALLDANFKLDKVNMTNILQYMDDEHLFNQQVWGDILLPNASNKDPSLDEFKTN